MTKSIGGFLLLFLIITAHAQRSRSDGYQPTTGDSHTRNYSGAPINEVDKYYQSNNPFTAKSRKYITEKEEEEDFLSNHTYPIVNFNPPIHFNAALHLQEFDSINIIDKRVDTNKVSLYPCDKSFMDQGYFMLGLQLQGNLSNWMREHLFDNSKALETGNLKNRQLVFLIKKFWFSYNLEDAKEGSIKDLKTLLHYEFDLFSLKDSSYYPLKKAEGILSVQFDKGNSYSVLIDSLLFQLKNQINAIQLSQKETEKNRISSSKFENFSSSEINKLVSFTNNKKGVYASYEDFLNNHPIADSIEMIVKYTNFGKSVKYACQIAGYQKSEPVSTTKAWGYYDGKCIYLNSGNGFYIRLVKWGNDYFFLFLKNIGIDKVTREMESHIYINNTPYKLFKNYATRKYSLIYKLDLNSGELF